MRGRTLGWLGSGILALGLMLTMDCTSASANGSYDFKVPNAVSETYVGGITPDQQTAPGLFGPWTGQSYMNITTTTETIRKSLPVYRGKNNKLHEAIFWLALWLLYKFGYDIWDTSIDQQIYIAGYPVTITSTPMVVQYVDHEGRTVVTSQTTYDFGILGKFVTQDELRIKQIFPGSQYYTVFGDKTLIYGRGTGIWKTATGNLNVGRGMGFVRDLGSSAFRDLREEGPFDWIHWSASLP